MEHLGKADTDLQQLAADLDKRETDLTNRELSVTEREQKVNEVTVSFNRKVQEFKNETARQQQESQAESERLKKVEMELMADRQAIEAEKVQLIRRELDILTAEQKRDAGFADERAALNAELHDKRIQFEAEAESIRQKNISDFSALLQEIEAKKTELTRREQEVITAEQKRNAGFADERATLNVELRDKRIQAEAEIENAREKKLSDLEDEIAKLKAKRLTDISNAEQVERDRIRAEITKEREEWTNLRDEESKRQEAAQTEFERQKGALSALQSENEGRKNELDEKERVFERKTHRSEQQWQRRHAEQDNEVEDKIAERRASLELELNTAKDEIVRLRDALRIQTELVGAFDQLKRQLGEQDPAEIIRDLNSKTDQLKDLREQLATRPTDEMRERYQQLVSDAQIQKARADSLDQQLSANNANVTEVSDLRRRNSELDAENKSLTQKATIFEGAANEAQAELNRLRAAYERPAEVEARYKEIEIPHIKVDKAQQPDNIKLDEMTWLTGIGKKCDEYGLHFNPRILKAFHTALKTAEWSPLTVLAGVSGTGKSELPRLYSHFGGLYFESLAVQPNWDSQESMLGFFNSIDNKFDAQPVLRFLAQSQKPWIEDYPGLADAVSLVLLDEMNLAHPELYFAEFLSKFESRRGKTKSDVPFLPVKIGAGMEPYKLPLGRNVLWAGTMNQDETTKSLSDKVLDRAIVINFPRPTELKRRLKLAPLNEKNRGQILHWNAWREWLSSGSDFSEEQINPFKEFIEKMNAALSVSGRALGHRVWQSIEYYMANYPDVRAAQQLNDKDAIDKAMHTAFEDQLVQKVMPKLRGIDTRGKSKTECLDKIHGQLVNGINGNKFNLDEDFNLAIDLGYGQFIWQSANYLNAVDDIPRNDSSKNVPDVQ